MQLYIVKQSCLRYFFKVSPIANTHTTEKVSPKPKAIPSLKCIAIPLPILEKGIANSIAIDGDN